MKSKFNLSSRLLTLCLCSLIFFNRNVTSQTLINELWEVELNYPDTIEWSASVLNSSNLYTTGNTWHNATQKVNMVTTKTNSSGTVIWSTEYNGTLSGFDYGSAICLDGSGNVIVAGATHNTSAYTFDIVVIKYNSSGVQQWATLFNGSGSNMDIPSGITLDGSGNIYVCGASMGSTAGYDYVTMKLNSSGTSQWTQIYDYASLSDLPGYIAWNSGTSKVGIAGASQSTATNWDYTTIKYNSSGTLTNTNRTSTAGYGFDRPTGLVTDASDNFYITGYVYNGIDYDMRTIKLDDDLSPLWTITENDGDEDGSNAICIDGSNNTYIAGFAVGSAGNKLMKIIKYNSSGTLQWEQILGNSANDIDAEATGITYNSTSGRVTICGFYKYSTGKKTITTYAMETSDGDIAWKKDYPNLNASIDVPTRIHESGNFIWVYGRRTDEDTTRYITLKYQTYENVSINSIDDTYLEDEIIIKVSPYVIEDEFVNEKQTQFETFSNVVNTATYNRLQPILCDDLNQCDPIVVKIYRNMIKVDSISITRLGSTIKNHKLWSTILIKLPEGSDIDSIIDTLNKIQPEVIFAQKNYLSRFNDVPNDELWAEQESLFSTTFPDAHINVEDGWDLTTGNSDIRVGVYDSGAHAG